MNYIKILSVLLILTFLNSKAQIFESLQFVDIEKYKGKDFILEGKIYYKDKITNDSWLVLAARSYTEKSELLKKPIYNSNAEDYYKAENEWSDYELTGKIDKNAKYLGVGYYVAGNGSYYIDDFKLFVKDGKNKIEIPLRNPDFESESLTSWNSFGLAENSKLSITKEKAFSGQYSLYFDNSNSAIIPRLGNNPELGKHMDINGVKLYYEVYGKGEPLLMLNGNNSSMARFGKQLDALSEKYMVIGLDSRGQGKSSDDDTKITYELMAEDVNTFLDKMNLKNVNILGWSDGGNIALILAMQHPDKINKMAIMGTVLFNDDTSVTAETNKLIRGQVKEMEAKGVAKNNMDYRLKVLLLTEPNINPDALLKIKAPTLVMAGQHDVIKEKHTKLIADKIPNSKLVIFKGAGHEAPEEIPELFNETVLKFFDQKN